MLLAGTKCIDMAINFKKYVQTGETFLKRLAIELGDPNDIARAGRVLRSVLHVFRDQSTPEESMQLISQLPMFLKAAYVNGWSIKKDKRKIRNMKDFIFLVRSFDGVTSGYDFESDEIAEKYIDATFLKLREYVSQGEMNDLKDALPKNLKHMIYDRIFF